MISFPTDIRIMWLLQKWTGHSASQLKLFAFLIASTHAIFLAALILLRYIQHSFSLTLEMESSMLVMLSI
jgi:hypothetical protein